MLETSRTARGLFVGAWIVVQIALVITSGDRSAHMGGFRMFPETSTIRYSLFREVAGRLVAVPDGEWNAKDSGGIMRHFSWRDRVRRQELCAFDREIVASYGVDTQSRRLVAALDDVFLSASGDAETTKLVLVVDARRNGRALPPARYESFARAQRAVP